MRTAISTFVLLAISMFYTARAAELLTKEEAKKQIEAHVSEYLYANFNIDKFVKTNRVYDNLKALKKEGYIDIVKAKGKPNTLEVIVLKKGQPLYVREENNKLFFRAADVETKITSVKELQGKNGSISYYVEYKEKLTRTRFMELWGVNHCFDGKEYNTHATLTKTKKGWKVEHEYFN